MIGILLYVTTSRPNLMQVVGLVTRFQATLEETHVQAVKRISIYMKGTLDLVSWYPCGNELTLEAYIDGD